MNRKTPPKSSTINVKIQVCTEKQDDMDEIVSRATKAWEKTVIEALLGTRRDVLETIGCQQSEGTIRAEWPSHSQNCKHHRYTVGVSDFRTALVSLDSTEIVHSGANCLFAVAVERSTYLL